MRIKYFLRTINRKLNLKQLWYQDNGNWHWLNVRHQIENFILDETEAFADGDFESISVIPKKGYIRVNIEVAAPLDSISQTQIERVRDALAQKINRQIFLDVEIIPMRRLTVNL